MRSLSPLLLIALALPVLPIADLACSSDPVASPAPAGAEAGAVSCDGAACLPPCPIVYVSPTGDDASDACGVRSPAKTVARAIAYGKTRQAGEIHLCRGTYPESALTLDAPIALRGGYSCDDGTRGAIPDRPTEGDAKNLSTIEAADSSASTLFIKGDLSTTVDGLVLHGSSVALEIAGNAVVHVTSSRIVGGSGKAATGVGSIGVLVEDAAAPILEKSAIDGGSGESTSGAGSIGILVRSSKGPRITGNVISGGSGKEHAKSMGSVGIWLEGGPTLTGDHAIAANDIDGGTGTADTGGIPSVAVLSRTTSDVELVGNQIRGGTGRSADKDATIRAIYAFGSGGLKLSSNRIYGGESADPLPVVAIDVRGAGALDVTNNFILHGNKSGAGKAGAAILLGADGDTMQGARVRANSILSLHAGSGGAAIVLGNRVRGAAVVDNLVMTGAGERPVRLDNCPYVAPDAVMTRFAGNALAAGATDPLLSLGCKANGPGPADAPTIAKAEALLAGVTASKNWKLATNGCASGDSPCAVLCSHASILDAGADARASDAGGDSGSPASTGDDGGPIEACEFSLFSAFTAQTSGYDELFAGGWTLAPGAPCAVAQGGIDLTTDPNAVTTDALGTARTPGNGISIGAAESDVPCR